MGMLDDKVAVVTGAGHGLGRCHALQLADQGARVIVNDVGGARDGSGSDRGPAEDVAAEIVAAGGVAEPNFADVASWDGAAALVDQAVDRFGRLDILVNNAGILRDRMSFNMSEDEWDAVVRVHLRGHFAPAHFAARHWRERAENEGDVGGRIINTSSEAGLFGNIGQANYSAAKAGIAALTLVLARELERTGVTVNAIAPRALTRMTEDLMGDVTPDDPDAFNPLAPANVSPVVAWLASDAASDVSGQLFIVWGDEVQLVQPHTVVGTVKAGDRRFEPDELTPRMKELFGDRDRGVPGQGVPPA